MDKMKLLGVLGLAISLAYNIVEDKKKEKVLKDYVDEKLKYINFVEQETEEETEQKGGIIWSSED